MRTRTRTLLIGLAALVALPCGAQSNLVARRNSLYFEGLGNGGLFSINYERLLTDGLSARVGFGSWPTVDFLALSEVGRGRITTVPVMLNVLQRLHGIPDRDGDDRSPVSRGERAAVPSGAHSVLRTQ